MQSLQVVSACWKAWSIPEAADGKLVIRCSSNKHLRLRGWLCVQQNLTAMVASWNSFLWIHQRWRSSRVISSAILVPGNGMSEFGIRYGERLQCYITSTTQCKRAAWHDGYLKRVYILKWVCHFSGAIWLTFSFKTWLKPNCEHFQRTNCTTLRRNELCVHSICAYTVLHWISDGLFVEIWLRAALSIECILFARFWNYS